jgi:hypothetical protein
VSSEGTAQRSVGTAIQASSKAKVAAERQYAMPESYRYLLMECKAESYIAGHIERMPTTNATMSSPATLPSCGFASSYKPRLTPIP